MLGIGWFVLMQVPKAPMGVCGQPLCCTQGAAFHSSPLHPLAPTFFLPLLPQCSLSLRYGELDIDVASKAEHSRSHCLYTWTRSSCESLHSPLGSSISCIFSLPASLGPESLEKLRVFYACAVGKEEVESETGR